MTRYTTTTVVALVLASVAVGFMGSLFVHDSETLASTVRARRKLVPGASSFKDNDGTLQMPCSNKKGDHTTMVSPEEFQTNPNCYLNIRDHVLFMHLGKAGGGTVKAVAKKLKLLLDYCHPKAKYCKSHVATAKRILINVRDPVDRMVSAFNWRALMLCGPDPNSDDRIPAYGEAVDNPSQYCKKQDPGSWEKEEANILHITYNYDVNKFAESLCLQGPKGDRARYHASRIQHMDPIDRWVQGLLSPESHQTFPVLQEVVAMVLEGKDYPLEETVSHALHYTMEQDYPSAYLTGTNDNNTTTTQPSLETEKADMHSSKVHLFPGGKEMATISDLGSCCMARHLQKDYQLLRALAGMEGSQGVQMDARLKKACHWGTAEDTDRCIQSIKSMVKRREDYFTNMASMSCEDALAS